MTVEGSHYTTLNPQDPVNDTDVPSPPEMPKQAEVADALWLYVSPIILIFGCCGNTLSLIVLRSSGMRKIRCSLVLSILAVVDLFVLNTGLLRQWIVSLAEVDIRTLSVAGCKIHIYLTYYSQQLSSWTLVVVAVGRLISVCAPFKARTWCRKRNLVISWGICAAVLACLNAPLLWTMTLVEVVVYPPENITMVECISHEDYKTYGDDILYWMDFALLCLIPFIIIITCNIVIIVTVTCRRPGKKLNASYSSSKKAASSSASSTTVMLILVCVVFLVTTVPLVAYFLGLDSWFADDTLEGMGQTYLLYTVTNLIYYVSNAINFVLYCMGGATFRQATLLLFCGRCVRKNRNTWRQRLLSTSRQTTLNDSRQAETRAHGSSAAGGETNRAFECEESPQPDGTTPPVGDNNNFEDNRKLEEDTQCPQSVLHHHRDTDSNTGQSTGNSSATNNSERRLATSLDDSGINDTDTDNEDEEISQPGSLKCEFSSQGCGNSKSDELSSLELGVSQIATPEHTDCTRL